MSIPPPATTPWLPVPTGVMKQSLPEQPVPPETLCMAQTGDMGMGSRQRCLETAEGLVNSRGA